MPGTVFTKYKSKIDFIDILAEREGNYSGTGVNHENKEFNGTLWLRSAAVKKGVSIEFRAVGTGGKELNKDTHLYSIDTILFIEESALICYDDKNELSLWSLNSNIGTMAKFELRRFRQISGNRSLFIFGYGRPEDNTIYREEITIELWESGELSYNYSWGEAGGHFLSRSVIKMKKAN